MNERNGNKSQKRQEEKAIETDGEADMKKLSVSETMETSHSNNEI